MNASQLMEGITGAGRGTDVATRDHAAIILPLLLLLGTVLLIGALVIVFARRYLSVHGRGYFSGTTGHSPEEFRSGRFVPGTLIYGPDRWVAVRNAGPKVVQESLGLHNPTPCSWTEGMGRVGDQKLFISPPVTGWVLVVGSLVPDPGEDVDLCFRFLQKLSLELGEVQFFSVNRAVGHHAWARFERGRVIRGYAWAGETLWNQGPRTWAERKLGMKCCDYGQTQERPAGLERSSANTEKVPLLASIWSVDPASIDDGALTDALGIAGDLSPASPR